MSDTTGLWVDLPQALLSRLDEVARGSGMSRIDALRCAVEAYVQRSTAEALHSRMAEGYMAMGGLNLALASEDADAFAEWTPREEALAEADPSGDS